MINAAFPESPTLDAISQLRREYPYAAVLLTYVAIERILKSHLVTARQRLSFPKKMMNRGPHKGKSLAAVVNLRDDAFLKDVVCYMTLGEVEEALTLPNNARTAKHRNDAMHSTLYLSGEARLTYRGCRRKNSARLKQAVAHLRYVVDHFTDHRVLEKRNGELIAQPNSPLQSAGSASG
jgi:hypothetical protein